MKRFIILMTAVILTAIFASSTGMAGGGKGYTVTVINQTDFDANVWLFPVSGGASSAQEVKANQTVPLSFGECPYSIQVKIIGFTYAAPYPAIFSTSCGVASCKNQTVTIQKLGSSGTYFFELTWQ